MIMKRNLGKDERFLRLTNEVKKNHIRLISLLVKNKANINASNKRGLTPLAISALSGHVGIVKFLIAHGANIDISLKAAKRHKSFKKIQMILQRNYA